MKLQKVRIQNFRSIQDSGEFSMDPKVTCLLGKNESGKTNILKSLEALSEGSPCEEDDICYQTPDRERFGEEDIEILECQFKIEKRDKEWLRDIHPKAEKLGLLKAKRYSNGRYEFEPMDSDLSIDTLDMRMPQIEKILERIDSETREFHKSLIKEAERHTPFAPQLDDVRAKLSGFLDFVLTKEQDESTRQEKFTELYDFLKGLPARDPGIQSVIDQFISSLQGHKNTMAQILKKEGPTQKFLKYLPSVRYVKDMEELVDELDMDVFLQDMTAHPTLRNLAALAGINVQTLKDMRSAERRRLTTRGTTKLTRIFTEAWGQGRVNVQLEADGNTLLTMIEDDTGGHDPPSKRSDGFIYFLAFLATYHPKAKKRTVSDTILLIDDPGLHLHADGQKDLLKLFERISESTQIIYSTHSPFLVDRNNLNRVRIVEKRADRKGTVVIEKFHHSTGDSLAPIRAAIGVTVGDSLFISEKTVIVEGYSDYLITEGMNIYLKSLGREHLDLEEVVILPVGGATKTPYFATILRKENFSFVVVLDNDEAGRNTHSKLTKMEYLDRDFLLKLDEAKEGDESKDISIENLVDGNLYRNTVLEVYGDDLTPSTVKKIKGFRTGYGRIPEKCKDTINESKKRNFNKVLVSKRVFEFLNEAQGDNSKISEESINAFEKLFSLINKKLESQQEAS